MRNNNFMYLKNYKKLCYTKREEYANSDGFNNGMGKIMFRIQAWI